MHSVSLAAVGAALLLATMPALATEPALALAQKNNCLSCHAVDHKLVGPSYREVAKKYAGQAGASQLLQAKIKAGGGGTWGPVPMPPNPQVSDLELRQIVAWLLKQ
ncbi:MULTISPECIES: c-type cytochrome [unclassified Chromobacterium]|uniref:c-type cytochrome n=1 Tax=unclassified Chromobacterium TaxID=2641838 RepID=UPI000653744A|nr:c-type cytochrome [Chromobacterium sp. LK1]KMN35164.1 hypothetical protein VI26_12845 [Chromobacterium sp. LK1]